MIGRFRCEESKSGRGWWRMVRRRNIKRGVSRNGGVKKREEGDWGMSGVDFRGELVWTIDKIG
jgi:hypothetical protein